MNQSQVTALQVKLSLEHNDETLLKRIPAVQTHSELYKQVQALAKKADIDETTKLEVFYIDSDNEKIYVTDDSDIQMAYALALSFDNKVKFQIQVASLKKSEIISQPIKQQVLEMPLVEEIKVVPSIPILNLGTEQVQVQAEVEDVVEEHHRKGKKCKKNKKCAGNAADMPRKAIKNLIQQELEKVVPGIFDKLMQESSQDVEESKEPHVEHTRVQCDGCGVNPIIGVRYKCAVCKDFDYCTKCENNLGHEHPFLKIRNPGGAPAVMVTVLNEEENGQQQEQAEPRRFRHGFGHHGFGHHGHHGHHGGKFFKEMIHGFLDKLGGSKEQKDTITDFVEKIKENCKQHKNQWGFANGESRCKGGQKHKLKRALLIRKPDLLEGYPGTVVLAEIEIKNDTHWGWKQGVFLGMDEGVEIEGMPIHVVHLPIDREVKAQETFKLLVPITIVDHALIGQEFEFSLSFRGPKGGMFGQPIPLKLRVTAAAQEEEVKPVPLSQIELIKIAVKLYDEYKLGQSFDEVLEIVTQVNGDEEAAMKSLYPRDLLNL